MPYLGWKDSMIDWRCLAWGDMMNPLFNDTGCDLAPSGFQPRADRIEKGLRSSVSSMRTGMSIMVDRKVEQLGPWYFFSGMTPAVWVSMIVTGCIVGMIVWLLEIGMRALSHDTNFMRNVFWDTIGRPVCRCGIIG